MQILRNEPEVPLWEIAVRLPLSAGYVSGSADTRPKSSDFGQAKLTKIEWVESATCGVRKDGVFGQASSPLTARLYRANPIHAEALQQRIQYDLLDEISGWHTQTMREAAVGA